MDAFDESFARAFVRVPSSDPQAQRLIDAWHLRWEEAVEHWPEIDPDPQSFVSRLVELVDGRDDLEALRWADLLLATECLRGNPRALAHFEAEFGTGVERAVARVRGFTEPPDEFRRELWAELLEPRPGRSPRLAGYAGRGSLAAWLRVIAVRRARDRVARAGREPLVTAGEADLVATSTDPELHYLKALYREEFKQAFAEAAKGLSTRERNLLRHSIIDGLTIDQIGRIYHVHRATAARQLDRAKHKLRGATRDLLLARLDLQPSALRSISRLVESQLDVSVRRVLTGKPDH